MSKKSEYEIRFTSLQDGKHDYRYKIEDTFFEQFDYSEIEGASLDLEVQLEKKPNMILVDFHVSGSLKVMCDRCTDSFFYPVEGKEDIVYKFGEEEFDDEKVMTIYPNDIDIDLALPIFEFTSLLLPSKRIHPDGKCNQEMLKEIDNYLMVESNEIIEEEPDNKPDEGEDEIDPRWAKLKNLKK